VSSLKEGDIVRKEPMSRLSFVGSSVFLLLFIRRCAGRDSNPCVGVFLKFNIAKYGSD
jgi:hypothetical protein